MDASAAHSEHKPESKPSYEVMIAVETTAANCHDSKPLRILLDKAGVKPSACIHADKAYCSQKHHDALRSRGIRNGIQDKAIKNKPLTQ